MERKRHGPEQIVAKSREADALLTGGGTIAQVCRKLEVAEATFHRWREQYGGMKAQEARRLEELEIESARLRKRAAHLALDNAMLKELAQGNF